LFGILEATPGAIIDDAKCTNTANFTLEKRQGRKLARSHKSPPLPITVKTFCRILFCLNCEDLSVEELLHSFVAIIDEELLEAIGGKNLKAVQIEEAKCTASM
jgi:hypothetical protein